MKPFANISLDLDNQWAYLRTAGKPEWNDYPSYLPLVCPLIVEALAEFDIRMTAFVVGRDLDMQTGLESVGLLVRAGHEIGNHSYHHEPWLHRFDAERIEFEVDRTDELLAQLDGVHARGFRGPGFSDSPLVRQILAARGYRFLASQFSSCVGPIARTYYVMKTGLRGKQLEGREKLFGSFLTMFGKNAPYQLAVGSPAMWMMPVTVMPWVRTPFHFSYLMFLSERSEWLARRYFSLALAMCQKLKVEPSLLLHPLDFLGGDEIQGLEFFPGMKQSGATKRARLRWFLNKLTQSFTVTPMGAAVARLDRQSRLQPVLQVSQTKSAVISDDLGAATANLTTVGQVVRN